MTGLRHVALVSLEPWDDIWRRNQHLATRVVEQGHVERVTFIEPPVPGRGVPTRPVARGVMALRPALYVPKRVGGLALVGRVLRATALTDVDLLWVNDPSLGVQCLRGGVPAVYDVTDDWREFGFPPRVRRRVVRAEDVLAGRAVTVVCSNVLADRWQDRYGVQPAVVPNGVDLAATVVADPLPLPGAEPHVGYVGTLHGERLDLILVLAIADLEQVGTVHLVGPDALEPAERSVLVAHPKVRLHGAVRADEVPAWLRSLDVLVCPHRISPFTLSLDAIKAHEYLASGRPVVATPTSGFQHLAASGVWVTADDLPGGVVEAISAPADHGPRGATDWSARTEAFASALHSAVSSGRY